MARWLHRLERKKIFEPDWRMFKVENGATFAVDRKSIVNISPNGLVVRVVAYLVEGDDFDPNDLITFAFDCKNFVEVVKCPLSGCDQCKSGLRNSLAIEHRKGAFRH
jgi:hypothetical protein